MSTAEVTAPVAATTAAKGKGKKPAAKKSGGLVSGATHPPVAAMVLEAIKSLNEKGGSSLQAIKKHMATTHLVDVEKLASFIRKALKKAVDEKKIVQVKGSFKLASGDSAAAKKATSKKPKAAKKATGGLPKAKKPASPKAKKPVAKKGKASPKKAKPQPKKAVSAPVVAPPAAEKPAPATPTKAKPAPKPKKAAAKPKAKVILPKVLKPTSPPKPKKASPKKKAAPKKK